MEIPKDRTVIVSDINERDGMGIEIYRDNQLVIEIFRDDTKLTRTVAVFNKEIRLDLLEESIAIFRNEIPWDFIDYLNLNKEE